MNIRVELINTGSELMLGRVLNTHQQWICRRMADLGWVVERQTAVPDTGKDIQQALRESLARAGVVIVTGGLGPTSDDLTRDLVANLLGKKLIEDAAIVKHIRGFFESRNRRMPESTRVQAMVPEGATVLPNPNGTAPGLAMELNPNPYREGQPSWVIMLPGPPRELRPMFDNYAVPYLKRVLPFNAYLCRTLRTTGIGESLVEEQVGPKLKPLVDEGLELGYCARTGQVDVRLACGGSDAERLVSAATEIVKSSLDPYIYGEDAAELEFTVVRMLSQRKQTVSTAESCTGGCIAHRITNVPGASEVFGTGVVTYSNAAKMQLLGVKEATLKAHGAVSPEVVREMADGIRKRAGCDYAVAVTGIAGPSGGSADKPVGTVYMAVASASGIVVSHQVNAYDRETFKLATSQQALDLLRREMLRSKEAA